MRRSPAVTADSTASARCSRPPAPGYGGPPKRSAKVEAHDDHDGPLQNCCTPAHLQRLRGASARATAREPGPSSRPHHHRHAPRGSGRRLRLRARADAAHRRARRAWRPLRTRIRAGTDHAAVARLADDGPVSARAWLPAQRHARRLSGSGDRDGPVDGRLCHWRVRQRVPARSSLRPECRLRDVW